VDVLAFDTLNMIGVEGSNFGAVITDVHICPPSAMHSLCASGSTGYVLFGIGFAIFGMLLGFPMGWRNLFRLVWPWRRSTPTPHGSKEKTNSDWGPKGRC